MRSKLKMLQRLATLYAVVEEMHSTELQRSTASVREAEQAIGAERRVAAAARGEGRGALIAGDQVGRMIAETQQETAAWRRERLERIRQEREQLKESAGERYAESRVKREQMKRVLEDLTVAMETEETRRMQSTSDDRFLARRSWKDRQVPPQGTARQMKSS